MTELHDESAPGNTLGALSASQSGEFTPRVRLAIFERARGACERCGHGGRVWEWHHRSPRGMGGVSNDWTGLASNGLLLCRACHRWVEQHRDEAYEHGWLVPIGGEPGEVPVLLHDGRRVLLDADGSYRPAVPTVEVPVSRGRIATAW